LEEVAKPDFAATDTIPVPACYDMMPKWYMKRGTGLYRRVFTLAKPMKDALLVVDGMGVRAKFELDGKDLGLHPYPYARLEIPVGPLAAGEHTVFAAVDNILAWPRVKLARPYYDFYFYGGFYHGVKLVEREPKVFVRTLDYKTGKVEDKDIDISDAKAASVVAAMFGEKNKGRPKIAFQLYLYDVLCRRLPKVGDCRIVNSVYAPASFFTEGVREIPCSEVFMQLAGESLDGLLAGLLSPEVPFARTSDPDTCKWCDFKMICGR
jgi:hypothetical protein